MKKRAHCFEALPVLTALAAGAVASSACVEVGGANFNEQTPGNAPGGVHVSFGELAVAPSGRYVFTASEGKLIAGDLRSKRMRVLEAIDNPTRVAFWPADRGAGLFVLSRPSSGMEVIASYDLENDRVVWTRALQRQDTQLDVSESSGAIAVWSAADDRHNAGSVVVLDAETGDLSFEKIFEQMITDIDLTRHSHKLIVTLAETRDEDRSPRTQISVFDTRTGTPLCEAQIPNCTSNLVLDKNESRGFLAPTRCGQDPVSVIEFSEESCRFEVNLPGFGPVALSPDGARAIAFLDRDAPELAGLPPIPEPVKTSTTRYHLMSIDTATLEFETAALGASLPRYTFTPDGAALLIDHRRSGSSEVAPPIAVLDLENRRSRPVTGDRAALDHYVLTPDSRHAFVANAGLFDLEIPEARMSRVSLLIAPESVNITPDGSTLLLKEAASSTAIHVFDVGRRRISGSMTLKIGG